MSQNAGSSRKRRREPYNVDVKLVEIYEDLANEKDEIRLKAAQELVSRFTPEAKPTDEQIQKALQRLFRGLCSGRKAARVGFSIALTEVLAQVFSSSRKSDSTEVNISKVLEIWESVSDAGGSESGQVGCNCKSYRSEGKLIFCHRNIETIILVDSSEQRRSSSLRYCLSLMCHSTSGLGSSR